MRKRGMKHLASLVALTLAIASVGAGAHERAEHGYLIAAQGDAALVAIRAEAIETFKGLKPAMPLPVGASAPVRGTVRRAEPQVVLRGGQAIGISTRAVRAAE